MKTRILALAIALCALLPMASASVAGMMWEGSSHADTLNTIPQPDTVRGKADSVSAQKVVSQAGKPQESDTTGTQTAADSIPQRAYTILPDTSLRDSLYKDTVRKSKSALEEPVSYSAKDSITFDYTNSRAHLFGGSQVNYQNLQLTADDISLSLDSSLVHASGRPDSTGAIQGKPLFKQGEDEYEPDRISYNFKTRKAFISNVYTQEGEGFMQSREGKRDSSGVMYVQNGKYTTCDAEHPHFYVSLTRAKMHPGKNVIFGPAYLVVEDVPLPLAIPYGFFPFSSSYKSGFIMPTYGDETTRGFYLRDGGYYFAINDKVDLKVLGEFYTKGSWGLSAQTNYKKRYRFGGNFFFSYQNTKEGEKNMPDYSVSKSFKLTWSHRQDAKANPTQSFSASVNFATSSYERNNLTSMYNPESYTQSTRTSSVSYSKTFSKVGLTLSGTFNLSQNMRDSSISVTLPTLSISQSRFNPFKRKKAAGKERWYEKIAMSYTGTLANSINTKEDKLFHSSLVKDWRNGMRHQVPISASFSVLNYINVTPSFTFTDRMYTHKVMQGWDTDRQAVQRDTVYGFYNVYNYNMSISANTKLYGMYRPMPWFGGKKIAAIRHVFTPTVSFSYAPDFSQSRFGFYDSYVKTDANGNVSTVRYSPFSGMMYGTVGQGMTGSVTMDVANNIEMKVRTDKDSTGYRKISLIDELGGSLSYNMAAKRRPWSDLNLRARIKLTKKYTYSMNAVFATYAYEKDENGRVYVGDHTEWSRGRFGRFQGTAQNISYSISNETFRKLFGKKHRTTTSDDELDEELDEEEETDPTMQNVDPDRKKGKTGANQESNGDVDEDGYLKFSLPWSINIGYGVTIRENTQGRFNDKRMRYPYKLSHTLNFSGNIRISEGWNINFSSGYDFNMHKLSMTTASLSRDLHCFQMSCSMVISPYTSYNFTFACKAGTLADALKWKKQSSYSSNIDWY
ncbi:MAG: putative LPS assembly protein LptD [Bacteroidaceae bacterium]|nr:putative LPS assembly protein LptD [Bacteroidaceae bacterium]